MSFGAHILLLKARLRLQICVKSDTKVAPQTCTGTKVHRGAIPDVRVPSIHKVVVNTGSLASNQSAQTVLDKIAEKCYQHISTSELEHVNGFLCYLEMVHKVSVTSCDAKSGSLIVTVEVGSKQVVEELRKDYGRGHLNQMAQEFLVTEELRKELGLIELELTTLIAEEEFQACLLSK